MDIVDNDIFTVGFLCLASPLTNLAGAQEVGLVTV